MCQKFENKKLKNKKMAEGVLKESLWEAFTFCLPVSFSVTVYAIVELI